eukprot:TRINITY_DN1942_c0_g1_i1.p1 TRINITY_DN1942_c0_g1~~TRINITY_DN1942_c0_g1_i1.p1  ORF type:complete len:721 (-),score=141.11 TRINITY_DN1942_c0_g1_i1:6-2168(-)
MSYKNGVICSRIGTLMAFIMMVMVTYLIYSNLDFDDTKEVANNTFCYHRYVKSKFKKIHLIVTDGMIDETRLYNQTSYIDKLTAYYQIDQFDVAAYSHYYEPYHLLEGLKLDVSNAQDYVYKYTSKNINPIILHDSQSNIDVFSILNDILNYSNETVGILSGTPHNSTFYLLSKIKFKKPIDSIPINIEELCETLKFYLSTSPSLKAIVPEHLLDVGSKNAKEIYLKNVLCLLTEKEMSLLNFKPEDIPKMTFTERNMENLRLFINFRHSFKMDFDFQQFYYLYVLLISYVLLIPAYVQVTRAKTKNLFFAFMLYLSNTPLIFYQIPFLKFKLLTINETIFENDVYFKVSIILSMFGAIILFILTLNHFLDQNIHDMQSKIGLHLLIFIVSAVLLVFVQNQYFVYGICASYIFFELIKSLCYIDEDKGELKWISNVSIFFEFFTQIRTQLPKNKNHRKLIQAQILKSTEKPLKKGKRKKIIFWNLFILFLFIFIQISKFILSINLLHIILFICIFIVFFTQLNTVMFDFLPLIVFFILYFYYDGQKHIFIVSVLSSILLTRNYTKTLLHLGIYLIFFYIEVESRCVEVCSIYLLILTINTLENYKNDNLVKKSLFFPLFISFIYCYSYIINNLMTIPTLNIELIVLIVFFVNLPLISSLYCYGVFILLMFIGIMLLCIITTLFALNFAIPINLNIIFRNILVEFFILISMSIIQLFSQVN